MFVKYIKTGKRLTFEMHPTEAERERKLDVSLGLYTASVDLPYDVGDIHPDILGLCAFLIAGPFAKDELTFQYGISASVAAAMSAALPNCKIGPIDDQLLPRERPEGGKPGLCFSGGCDSTAAMEILPLETELFS